MKWHHLQGVLTSTAQVPNMHLNSSARDNELPAACADAINAANNPPA